SETSRDRSTCRWMERLVCERTSSACSSSIKKLREENPLWPAKLRKFRIAGLGSRNKQKDYTPSRTGTPGRRLPARSRQETMRLRRRLMRPPKQDASARSRSMIEKYSSEKERAKMMS